jgi:starch synthase
VAIFASEFTPLAKVGGLGDVIAALSYELVRLGVSVTVWLPGYREILDQPLPISELRLTRPLRVPLGGVKETVTLSEYQPPGGPRIILVEHPPSFDRPGIYNDPDTGDGYADNDRRSIVFQRAALEGLKAIDLKPDVIHLNDYQTALVPAYLKTVLRGDAFFENTGTLFTIHNLGYQGIFPAEVLKTAGLSMDLFYPAGPLEFWGRVNFMKAAIVFSDLLSTVSPQYAREIQTTEEFGFGLEGVLRSRSKDLRGILNGVDYAVWDPASPETTPYPFSAADLSGKARNKAALLTRVGFGETAMAAPLIGIVSRLVDQKGFDLLPGAVPGLLEQGHNLVVLGTGQRRHEDALDRLARSHPDRVAYIRAFDDPLAHLIEAGSDFVLMPSKYEPCGLNQIISLRYGTIPIVRETGGLVDTVQPYDPITGEGTGFRFKEYTVEALLAATADARAVYGDPPRLETLRRNGMSRDFSWTRSAREYVGLYQEISSARSARKSLLPK